MGQAKEEEMSGPADINVRDIIINDESLCMHVGSIDDLTDQHFLLSLHHQDVLQSDLLDDDVVASLEGAWLSEEVVDHEVMLKGVWVVIVKWIELSILSQGSLFLIVRIVVFLDDCLVFSWAGSCI